MMLKDHQFWMVEGWRLARRKEIVSRLLEKICSTATAEPGMTRQFRLQKKTKEKKTHQQLREHHKQVYKHLGIGHDDYPPLDMITWIKILSWNLKILLQLIDINPLLLVSSHKIRGLYTPPRIPCGVCAESEDCLRTKFGQILAEILAKFEIPAKFENLSLNLVRGQS